MTHFHLGAFYIQFIKDAEFKSIAIWQKKIFHRRKQKGLV